MGTDTTFVYLPGTSEFRKTSIPVPATCVSKKVVLCRMCTEPHQGYLPVLGTSVSYVRHPYPYPKLL